MNDPDVNNAATKIQAKFRGHKARQDVEKMKHVTSDLVLARKHVSIRLEQRND